jgi:hypothetical protein
MKFIGNKIEDVVVGIMDAALEFKYNLKDEICFVVKHEGKEMVFVLDSIQDNLYFGNDNKCLIMNLCEEERENRHK